MDKFEKGGSFVREKTGSATMVNLDGEWEHDFVDDNTAAGKKNKVNTTNNKLKKYDKLSNKTN
ncbi:hypothetical protein ACOBQJ_00615 [Pelotomaculum propionicicum]|uniref:hypothetical protein n=1 Tax=Pelotomaculum propionicicum TaxID=258475 RepID=UPI003B7ECED9